MIKNIGSVIESKCEQGRFPESLRNQIYHDCHSFEDARKAVRQQIQEKKLIVPNKIDYLNNRVLVSVNSGSYTENKKAALVHVQNNANASINQHIIPARTKSQLKFNYQQPKEYFHPQMYVKNH